MRTIHRSRTAISAFVAVLAFALSAPIAANADDWWADAPAPAPSLTDVSAAARTPALFTVAGEGFTPGGRVYLAVYDQMGARLYETRWIAATAAGSYPIAVEHSRARGFSPGGTLREAFADLCGATAMLRALDEATATWSNWLTVAPACAADPATGVSWDVTSGYAALEAGRAAVTISAPPSGGTVG